MAGLFAAIRGPGFEAGFAVAFLALDTCRLAFALFAAFGFAPGFERALGFKRALGVALVGLDAEAAGFAFRVAGFRLAALGFNLAWTLDGFFFADLAFFNAGVLVDAGLDADFDAGLFDSRLGAGLAEGLERDVGRAAERAAFDGVLDVFFGAFAVAADDTRVALDVRDALDVCVALGALLDVAAFDEGDTRFAGVLVALERADARVLAGAVFAGRAGFFALAGFLVPAGFLALAGLAASLRVPGFADAARREDRPPLLAVAGFFVTISIRSIPHPGPRRFRRASASSCFRAAATRPARSAF